MQRRAELRREVIRGMRSEENNANRGGSLPFSDLPPAYINLALDGESRIVMQTLFYNNSFSAQTEHAKCGFNSEAYSYVSFCSGKKHKNEYTVRSQ